LGELDVAEELWGEIHGGDGSERAVQRTTAMRIWMPTMTTIGERSSAMPPSRTGGKRRRTGPSTGSVSAWISAANPASGDPEEIGIQLRTMRTMTTMR